MEHPGGGPAALRRFDQQSYHRQQAKSHQRLYAAFELRHPSVQLENSLHRIFDTNRQHNRCQAESITQLAGLLDRSQVHRDHGPDFLALHRVTSLQGAKSGHHARSPEAQAGGTALPLPQDNIVWSKRA